MRILARLPLDSPPCRARITAWNLYVDYNIDACAAPPAQRALFRAPRATRKSASIERSQMSGKRKQEYRVGALMARCIKAKPDYAQTSASFRSR